jgi:xanthine/uracil/vitamin C permease (AzgA family)
MPTVKQSIGIAIAIAMAFVAATAFGISVVEQTATQVATSRFTASNPSSTVRAG